MSGGQGALEADERNFDLGAERISTQVEYLIRFEQPMRSLRQAQQLQKRKIIQASAQIESRRFINNSVPINLY
ncbi:unnamed protein product [Sphagnum compactum]